jgi:GT2 family glycosyltransferase
MGNLQGYGRLLFASGRFIEIPQTLNKNAFLEELIALSESNPLVSIVVLNYNGEKYLQNCIRTVLENKYPNFEVLLVDNASTDGSIAPIQDRYGADPRLQIIVSKKNLGFSGGNNLGLKYSKGKYIVFLNNDTTVEPDWLIHLVDALENDSTIGIAQSLIYAMDKRSVLSAGWVYSDYLIRKYALCADDQLTYSSNPFSMFPLSAALQ